MTVLPGAAVNVSLADWDVAATAIDVGAGKDVVFNDGRVSIANATPSASVRTATSPQQCIPPDDKRGARVIGIDGGSGNDVIWNRGTVVASNTTGPASSADEALQCEQYKSADKDDKDADATVSVGIQGSDGDDFIENSGSVSVTAAHEGDGSAAAYGIAGADGREILVNTGTVTVAATVTHAGEPDESTPPASARGSTDGDGDDKVVTDDEQTIVSATATGMSGDGSTDAVVNVGTLSAGSNASVNSTTREASPGEGRKPTPRS